MITSWYSGDGEPPTERQNKTRRRLRQRSPTAVSNNEDQTANHNQEREFHNIRHTEHPRGFQGRDQKPIHTTVTICRRGIYTSRTVNKKYTTVSAIAKTYIPKRNRQKKAWMKNTAMDIAEERRMAKSRGDLEGWASLNKEFRKAANADKRYYLKEMCQHLEQSNKNQRKLAK